MLEHELLSRAQSIVETSWLPKQDDPEMLAEDLRNELYDLKRAVEDRVPLLVPVLPLRNTVLFPHTSFTTTCDARSSDEERLIESALDADDDATAKKDMTSRDVTSCLVGFFTSRSVDVEGVLEDDLNSIGTVARITVLPHYEAETETRKTSSCSLEITGIARIEIIDATKKIIADPRLDLTTLFLQREAEVEAQEPVYVKARILALHRQQPTLVQGKSAGTALQPKFQADLDKIARCFSALEPRLLPPVAEPLRGMWTAIAESWKLAHGRLSDTSVDATASAPTEDGIHLDEDVDEEWEAAYAGTYLLAGGDVDMGMIADCLATTLQTVRTLPLSVASLQILLEALDVNERVELLSSCLARLQETLPGGSGEKSREDKNAIIMRSDAKHARSKLQEYAGTPAGAATEEFRKNWIAVNEKRLDEGGKMEARIGGADMPDAVRQVARRELSRLARLPQSDYDYSKTADYLDLLLDLPWQSRRLGTGSTEAVSDILNRKSSGLHEAKQRVIEYMAVVERKRKRDGSPNRGLILCLAGPPGVGKTSLAQGVADALGHGVLARVSCGGMRDEVEIRGHNRTYAGSQPGQIIREMRRVKIRNPVFVLDEIDKIGGASLDGDPSAALLELLDPEQNSKFRDNYLGVPFDMSEVFFIATANVPDLIPGALRDRLELITLPGYKDREKVEIALNHIVPRQLEEHGLSDGEDIDFDEAAVLTVIEKYTQEVGVRSLNRRIGAICAKVTVRLQEREEREALRITPEILRDFLGDPTHNREDGGIEGLRARVERTLVGERLSEAYAAAVRELRRLSVEPAGAEQSKGLDYLRWLVNLPWSSRGEEGRDSRRSFAEELKENLDRRHYGLEAVKELIVEHMAAEERKRKKDRGPHTGPILCLAGPPGLGKTTLAQGIADALGHKKLARVSCGGMREETEIRGHNRAYASAQPGQIIREMQRVKIRNPVFVLDEIDKIGGAGLGGGPSAALLELLDPEQNDKFRDNYLGVPFDMSEVFFIATANVPHLIPAALRDRLEVIELPGYTEDEKVEIARRHLVERQVESSGLSTGQVRLRDAALRALIRGYTHEAGVRNLARVIGTVCRKMAMVTAEGSEAPIEVDEDTLVKMLGEPRCFDEEVAERTKRPGVAVGLTVSSMGGRVGFVEARRMSGGGTLTLTGLLGDTMKESARAALSWVRANAGSYDVDPTFYQHSEVHLHVPLGDVPKDGPSAGITMVTALVSELTGRPVRGDLAMTGEITLSGHVLRVGGIEEKVLAACRQGIVELILPRQNAKEVNEELSEDLRRQINVHYVSEIDAVLEIALLGTKAVPAQ